MLRGFTTITYWADDMAAARQWYTELLGVEPYFQRPNADNPAYVEFRIGDYQHELGLIDRRYAGEGWDTGTGGVVMYWQVDDVAAAVDRLRSMGAKEYEPVTEREAGFVTAAVVDPFGNIVGLMHRRAAAIMRTLVVSRPQVQPPARRPGPARPLRVIKWPLERPATVPQSCATGNATRRGPAASSCSTSPRQLTISCPLGSRSR